MWTFLASGTLYLLGVAFVLVYKPRSMFTPDGNWKEFGIGKREDRYTIFPFWLFCLTWAIISYIIVTLVQMFQGSEEEEIILPKMNNKRNNGRNSGRNRRNMSELESNSIGETIELPKGYYVLNEKATQLSGVPKYIYLGPEEN